MRLGQRVVQVDNSCIILTGFNSLNMVLGRQVCQTLKYWNYGTSWSNNLVGSTGKFDVNSWRTYLFVPYLYWYLVVKKGLCILTFLSSMNCDRAIRISLLSNSITIVYVYTTHTHTKPVSVEYDKIRVLYHIATR